MIAQSPSSHELEFAIMASLLWFRIINLEAMLDLSIAKWCLIFMKPPYTVSHLLVVEVRCVLFLTRAACIVQKQNPRNFYHKQMKDCGGW